MYNLFQAFHLGTNRALFLMEPRPHVRQTEATFITGPRALEGVQEVFLVVVRPKVMLDFCVSALLETAHITKQLKEVPEERRDKLQPVRWGPGHHENVFYPDPDFVFDWDGKFAWSYGSLPDFFNVSNVKIGEEKAPGYLRVQVDVGEEGRWNVDLVLHMKSKRMALKEHARKMFLSARELCCCPPLVPVPPDRIPLPDWITSTSDLSRMRSPIYPGLMSRSRFAESRRLSAAIRDEMVRSLRSSGRQPRGKLRYVDSDAFHTRVADVLRISGRGERLRLSIANVRGLSDELRGRLYRARGSCTIDDVLTTDSTILARMLDIDLAQIGQLKAGLLREVGRIP
jgi:hypothetical protein